MYCDLEPTGRPDWLEALKQNGVGTPCRPPMTGRLKCRIDREQSPDTCMLPEHKPVRRGRENLLAVEEPSLSRRR